MKLHFRAFGEGPPLLLLHGLLGSLDNWQSLSRKFAADFKVFAVDLRNHGRSPHSDEFGYAVMAHDLHELMTGQNLASAFVLGHSMGGKTAMHFALHDPDRVKKLVVVDIAPRAYAPRHTDILQALLAMDVKSFHRRDQLDAALAKSIDEPEIRAFLLMNVQRDSDGAFRWRINLRGIWDNYQRLNAPIETSRPFSGPALFVRGERSDYIQETDLEPIRRLFPRAEIHTVSAAGHWVHVDAPEIFCRAVAEFLKK